MTLFEKWESRYTPEPNTGCWLWTGPLNGKYGQFTYYLDKVKIRLFAHRAGYIFLRGPIPVRMTLDHLCRNTICVNPFHLEAVTIQENLRRGFAPPAINARKTLCKRGHELSGDNLLLTKKGKERQCRICVNAASNERQKRVRREKRNAEVRAVQKTISCPR